jgi:hypothetical protein
MLIMFRERNVTLCEIESYPVGIATGTRAIAG